MNTGYANAHCNDDFSAASENLVPRSAAVLRQFSRPDSDAMFRAYDHLIGARLGMTLMIPVASARGPLLPVVDHCPVPWLEATAILAADYATATPLALVAMVQQARCLRDSTSPLGRWAYQVLAAFLCSEGATVALADSGWRHTQITLAQGGEPCRVLIGAAGVRLAFTPDFLEGLV